MNRLLMLALVLAASLGTAVADQQTAPPSIEPVLERMLADYIRPGYGEFNRTAAALHSSVEELCAAPSVANLEATRTAFRAAVDSWARIEWLRLGPVMSGNRLERVLFFPDRKGTGRKQVQSAIGSKDASVTNVSSLAGQSVAMQGLGAAEFILFGSGSDALAYSKASHRCAFAQAVAANLVNIAGEIIAGWGPESEVLPVFLKPGATNPFYRTGTEALNLLLGQMIHGLEAIRDTRIGAFLDTENPDRDRPKSALFWRSDMTLPSIRAGLSGLQTLFTGSGIEVVARANAPKLAAAIGFEFTQAIRTADSLDAPVADLLANPQTREKLAYLAYAIRIIIGRLDQEFAQAGGLAVGFSFGDGD